MYQGKYLNNPKAPAPRRASTPAPRTPREKPQKRKKRVTPGTVIFYLLYVLCICAAFFALYKGYGMLEDWLVRFEASQPDTKSKEFFAQLFEEPDWGALYTQCGLEDTLFEGKDAYVRYMEQKIGDQELTYSMTSAGLSGGQKYIVRAGSEKVATFTIQNHVTGELEIPDWKLENVEILEYPRVHHVAVTTQTGRTVTVNGIPLDESYLVKTTSSTVEKYLPEGIHGPSTATFYADGFLVEPEVLVIDAQGNLVEMTYDAAASHYSEAGEVQTFTEIPQAEKEALVNATKAYGRAMIGANTSAWRKLFVRNTQIYNDINRLIGNDSFFKGYTSYGFSEPTVSQYCRYTEDLFSAKIQFTLNTYRSDGSVKPFDVDSTIFMTRTNGSWLVENITNVDVHEINTQVRLSWYQDGQLLKTEMVDATTDLLTPPVLTVPQGQTFVGWFKESMDENGDTTLSLVFAPTDSANISLPMDYLLDPMELHARFEAQGE